MLDNLRCQRTAVSTESAPVITLRAHTLPTNNPVFCAMDVMPSDAACTPEPKPATNLSSAAACLGSRTNRLDMNATCAAAQHSIASRLGLVVLVAVVCVYLTVKLVKPSTPPAANRPVTIEDVPDHVIEEMLELHYSDILGDRRKRQELSKVIRLANAEFALAR